jgi:hypothetical protein
MNHDFDRDPVTDDEFIGDLADMIELVDAMTHERLSGGELERRRSEIMDRVRGRTPAKQDVESYPARAPRLAMDTVEPDQCVLDGNNRITVPLAECHRALAKTQPSQAHLDASAVCELPATSRLIEIVSPPRPRRRPGLLVPALAAVLVAAIVALIGISVGGRRFDIAPADCRGGSDGQAQVSFDGGQCVGLTGTDSVVFGADAKVRSLQAEIFAENAAAGDRWARHDDRPIVTIVYLTSFALSDEHDFVAEREGLLGAWYAQRRANQEAQRNPTTPYVQILVANAGVEGAFADQVVTRILDRFAVDKQIIAVVATIDSRAASVAALRRLGDAGLPVMSPTMSADGLGDQIPLFLQLAAPTSVQADLVHHYATHVLKVNTLTNYFTYGRRGVQAKGSDLYVDTLRSDLAKDFGPGRYRERLWSSGTSLSADCRNNSVIFFGGRYTEFAAFLAQIGHDCEGRMPAVVADGSVARFMANADKRKAAPAGLAVAFVSGGYLGSCAVLGEQGLPAANRHLERQNYLLDVGGDCDRNPAGQIAGWSALTYDAARLLTRAMQENTATIRAPGGPRPWQAGLIQPASLYQRIRHWSDAAPYNGVTGPISFNGADRYAAMVCARNVQGAYRTAADTPHLVDSVGAAYLTDPRASGERCRPD